MIDLETKTLTLRGKSSPITHFEVWFRTPVGIITHLDDAIDRMRELDMDPRLSIIAIPVAIAQSGEHEELPLR